MAVFYLGTSVLAKRYVQESGTDWITALTDPTSGNDLYTVRLTGPELISALFRKVRTGEVTADEAARLARDFRTDWQQQYHIVEVTPSVSDRAMELAQQHDLRGYDAVHLAAAVALQQLRQDAPLSPITFVSSDAQQLRAARQEGLPTEDPSQYL